MNISEEIPTPGQPTVGRVHHVGYGVPDLDQAIAFFTEALGFTLMSRGGPLMAGSGPDDTMTRVFGVHRQAKVTYGIFAA